MSEGLPATTYLCGYMAFAGTVIMVDRYVSGKRKGLVKRITIADAEPTPTGDWVTSSDPKYWDMYGVEELTECTGRDCEKYRDKCPYCSGHRFYFKRLDNEGTYLREMHSDQNIRMYLAVIYETLAENESKCMNVKVLYEKHSHLW